MGVGNAPGCQNCNPIVVSEVVEGIMCGDHDAVFIRNPGKKLLITGIKVFQSLNVILGIAGEKFTGIRLSFAEFLLDVFRINGAVQGILPGMGIGSVVMMFVFGVVIICSVFSAVFFVMVIIIISEWLYSPGDINDFFFDDPEQRPNVSDNHQIPDR